MVAKGKKKAARKPRCDEQDLILIPSENNTSVYQRQHGIEALATAVFQIIQGYSKEVSYRNLLNTKLSTFQTIKFETVKYSLIGPNNWNRLHPLKVNFMENALLNIINSVKDKSRQISMSFDDVKQPTLVKYAHLFQEIFKFHLTGCYSTKN
jgi:hypothetical protein